MNDQQRLGDSRVSELDRTEQRRRGSFRKLLGAAWVHGGVVIALAGIVVSILILASNALGRVETRINENMTRIETRIYNDLDRVEKRLIVSISDLRADTDSLESKMQSNHTEVLSEIRELRRYLFEQK